MESIAFADSLQIYARRTTEDGTTDDVPSVAGHPSSVIRRRSSVVGHRPSVPSSAIFWRWPVTILF